MAHDPIASPTVKLADNREPVVRHAGQEEAAQRRIADYAARHGGRKPNVLVDLFPTVLALAGAASSSPEDRFIDGVDQTSFPLCQNGESNRKHIYYWLGRQFSALRVGEYKFMLASISDDDRDVHNPGGFTGVSQKYSYGRLYNLYLDPKETRSYLISKLAYLEAFQSGVKHLVSFKKYPPKVVVGL
jgi:arylsulfatase